MCFFPVEGVWAAGNNLRLCRFVAFLCLVICVPIFLMFGLYIFALEENVESFVQNRAWWHKSCQN